MPATSNPSRSTTWPARQAYRRRTSAASSPRAFGEAPHQYLLTRRLERAAALLRTTDWSVARVCFAVGWESVGSFTASFGRMFATTPTAYRASWPPAARFARIPLCVAQSYGQPRNRTFREDGRKTAP